MCTPGYYQFTNGLMVTHALGHMMYSFSTFFTSFSYHDIEILPCLKFLKRLQLSTLVLIKSPTCLSGEKFVGGYISPVKIFHRLKQSSKRKNLLTFKRRKHLTDFKMSNF